MDTHSCTSLFNAAVHAAAASTDSEWLKVLDTVCENRCLLDGAVPLLFTAGLQAAATDSVTPLKMNLSGPQSASSRSHNMPFAGFSPTSKCPAQAVIIDMTDAQRYQNEGPPGTVVLSVHISLSLSERKQTPVKTANLHGYV